MAKFYPDTPGSFNGSEGEEQVYETLQELDSHYVVFHSFRWVGDVTLECRDEMSWS